MQIIHLIKFMIIVLNPKKEIFVIHIAFFYLRLKHNDIFSLESLNNFFVF